MMNRFINLALLVTAVLSSNQAVASNTSLGGHKQQLTEQRALIQLKDQNQEAISINDKNGKTRQQVLQLKAIQAKTATNKHSYVTQSQPQAASSYYHEFTIYQGYAQLIEDYDKDGFYQTFSVTFDADVHSYSTDDHARVYAELYLSEDGGDWIHYYTTENFSIYGESEDDMYEVYTTLDQGYDPNHYDVLIDLYEVGYSDIVATYSSDDTNELYALPLESSDYDPDYVKPHNHSHGHGGSTSWLMLSVLALTLLLKKKNNRFKLIGSGTPKPISLFPVNSLAWHKTLFLSQPLQRCRKYYSALIRLTDSIWLHLSFAFALSCDRTKFLQ